MKTLLTRSWLLSGVLAATACALNPQPIPPEDEFGASDDKGSSGSEAVVRDAGSLGTGSGSSSGGSSSGGSSSGGPPSADSGVDSDAGVDDGGVDADAGVDDGGVDLDAGDSDAG